MRLRSLVVSWLFILNGSTARKLACPTRGADYPLNEGTFRFRASITEGSSSYRFGRQVTVLLPRADLYSDDSFNGGKAQWIRFHPEAEATTECGVSPLHCRRLYV